MFMDWYSDQMGESVNMRLVGPDPIFRWKHQQLDEGASPATINQRLSALRGIFTWLVLTGRRMDNPGEQVGSISLAEGSPEPLIPEDEARLLRELDKRARIRWGEFVYRDRAIIVLFLNTGIRISELLDLRVGDVRLRQRSGSLHVQDGLGREIELEPRARQALGAYLDQSHPAPEDPAEPLWYGPQGPISSRSTINRMISRYADYARLSDRRITPQRLRDTFAVNYLNQNPGDLQGLSELMGLDDLSSAERYI